MLGDIFKKKNVKKNFLKVIWPLQKKERGLKYQLLYIFSSLRRCIKQIPKNKNKNRCEFNKLHAIFFYSYIVYHLSCKFAADKNKKTASISKNSIYIATHFIKDLLLLI